jgi:hypothetical protein
MSLIKASDRALRQSCPKCGRPGSELYWAEDTDQPGKYGKPFALVLIDKTPQTFAAKKGDEVPRESLHPCTVEDADPLNGHRVVTVTVNARISVDAPWS